VKPLRIGLAGYGFGGRYFHAPFIASAEGCEFAGVVTTSEERKLQVAERFPDLATFASLEELAGAGADSVTISTPAATHTDLAQRALRLGLGVVCDKPFALDAPAARETVLLAEQLQQPLTVFQNRRWDSDFRTVQKVLADGLLGEPVRFESRFERYEPDPGPPDSGGGTLLDFGSHLVDQALVLFGPASSVYAEMHAPPGGLDDDTFVAIAHASGVRSHLWGSWRQSAPGPRFRVTGTRASYVVTPPMDGQEAVLVAGGSPASNPNWGA
jgi:predicted dehydrogenase